MAACYYKPHVVQEMRRGEQILPLDGPSAPEDPKRVIQARNGSNAAPPDGRRDPSWHWEKRTSGWMDCRRQDGHCTKIDPGTKRYSATKVIASFTGFAPINNPAVTILVSIDSPAVIPMAAECLRSSFQDELPNRFCHI